jgi:hypothetical protein
MSKVENVVVRFQCLESNCSCESVVFALVTVSESGGRLYEYKGNSCPKCGHKLFRVHEVTGEAAMPMAMNSA